MRTRKESLSTRHTRLEFLRAVGVGTAWITLASMLGCEPAERKARQQAQAGRLPSAQSTRGVHTFRTRPQFRPPTVGVSTRANDTAAGYVFVAPKKGGPAQGGAMILDNSGQPIWFRPTTGRMRAHDFKVQYYRGEPVLTWGERKAMAGENVNEYVIMDSSYEEITRVRAGNGYRGDHHEFLITPQDTALLTIYDRAPSDLSSVGGPEEGAVLEGIAQEVDIESGEVLFEWHSLEHVGVDESYAKPGEGVRKTFDYFHINSIDLDHDSNLLISARNTFAVYKVDRNTGEVIWRLGGKKSDFEMGPGARFACQHDAHRQSDGSITIFDNHVGIVENGLPKVFEESRGIALRLDEEEMRATLVREYKYPDKQFAHAAGNMQVLPNGNVFIGWGRAQVKALPFSEFSKDGDLLFSASLPPRNKTYRAFRFPWSGHPNDHPIVAVEPGPGDKLTVYASWNGATGVAGWQVLAGPGPAQLEPIGSAPRDGFETIIAVNTTEPYLAVQAKHRSGRVLGTSKAAKLRT